MTLDGQLLLDGSTGWDGGDPVVPSVFTGLNADLIAAIAPLYLTGTVLDVTFGQGHFWRRWRPAELATHDIELDGVDFRHLPESDHAYDTVVYDPPYVPASGNLTGDELAAYRERYGIDVPRSHTELTELILAGLEEAIRVSSDWVLVKCMDYVANRKLQLMHRTILDRAEELGLVVHDLIIHASGMGPGHKARGRATRAHSYLIVLRHDGRRRRYMHLHQEPSS